MTPKWRPNGGQNLYKNYANFHKKNLKFTQDAPKWEHQMEARGGPKTPPGAPGRPRAPPGHPPGTPGRPRAAPDPKTTPKMTKI